MRNLTAVLLLFPALALASGAEDTEFHGQTASGALVKVKFVEDGQPWSKRNFIYGSKTVKAFAFCWAERINEVRQSFVCASSRGASAALTYAVVQKPEGSARSEYKQIARLAKLGDGSQRGDGTLEAVYVCKSGCSASTPTYIFEVTKYD